MDYTSNKFWIIIFSFFSLTYKLYPNVLQTDAHIRLPSVWVSECVRAKFTFRRIVNYHVITDNLQWFCFFNFQHFSLVSLSHWFRFWCTTRSVYDKSRRTNTEVQTRSSDGRNGHLKCRMNVWLYERMDGHTGQEQLCTGWHPGHDAQRQPGCLFY